MNISLFEAIDDKLLDSFIIKDTLNPAVWVDMKLKPEIRASLLEIATDFHTALGIKAEMKDIVFTGSLANYNWSEYSDVDLHIVVDFKEIGADEEFIMSFFLAAIANWNLTHNISIHGFGVEIFVEDSNKSGVSSGIYSVMNDEWLVKPTKDKNSFTNRDSVRLKSEYLMYEIDQIQELADMKEWDAVVKGIKYIKLRLRLMRAKALAEGGEYATENLAYKVLRREGYLDKLNDLNVLAYDSLHTIE